MLILLPPSEGKKTGGKLEKISLSRKTNLPLEIAISASEKDLKCTGKRYADAVALNKNIDNGPRMPAIERYSGVMYAAINYQGMSLEGQHFFNQHIGILSGLYGFVRPQDQIANYKLPVNTKLKHFWKEKLTEYINSIESESVVDVLSGPYREMIDWKKIKAKVIQVERQDSNGKKLTHGVKKIKGEWLHNFCEQQGRGYDWENNSGKNIFEV